MLRLIQKLDKTNLQKVMRRDLKKLRVGYKKGILRRKLLLLTGFDLEKLLKSLDVHLSENLSKETLFLFIHLEDKVDFSGASKGNDRRWVSDTVKKKLRNVKDDVNKGKNSVSRVVCDVDLGCVYSLGREEFVCSIKATEPLPRRQLL